MSDEPLTESDDAYDCGWHDGVDYGYRLAKRETNPQRPGRPGRLLWRTRRHLNETGPTP